MSLYQELLDAWSALESESHFNIHFTYCQRDGTAPPAIAYNSDGTSVLQYAEFYATEPRSPHRSVTSDILFVGRGNCTDAQRLQLFREMAVRLRKIL